MKNLSKRKTTGFLPVHKSHIFNRFLHFDQMTAETVQSYKLFPPAEEGTTFPVDSFSTLVFPSTKILLDWRMTGFVARKPSDRRWTTSDLSITALVIASWLYGHLLN